MKRAAVKNMGLEDLCFERMVNQNKVQQGTKTGDGGGVKRKRANSAHAPQEDLTAMHIVFADGAIHKTCNRAYKEKRNVM